MLVDDVTAVSSFGEFIEDAVRAELIQTKVVQVDVSGMSCTLEIPQFKQTKYYTLKLVDRGGRYLRIQDVRLLPALR